MKRLLPIVLVLLVAACQTARVAPGPGGHIDGQVVDETGNPLPGVTVTVTFSVPNQSRVTVTDWNGRYSFAGLAPANYLVTATLAGYGQTSTRVAVDAAKGVTLVSAMHASVSETITVTAAAGLSEEIIPQPQYAHVAEHGFVDTRRESTTTFAIDVDRASYANIRRFLTTGELPPPDAVRIEEMVNYFTYSYPQPADGAPFSVTTEVAGCPWDAAHRLLRVGIQGRNLEEWRMAPNNLVFLLDVSGSMSPPARLPLIQSAFRVLADRLRAEDRVSIVVYAGAAGLVLPPTSGADKQTILAALDQLEAGGSTAGGEGIELAYKVARENFLESGNNRVILATDGDFNVGVSGSEELEKLIVKQRQSGIFLSVIGVGDDNYQDAAMETLADKGNGNFAYLDSMKEAEKVFRDELTGTLVTIAKDVKVQLAFDPNAVRSYRQIGYENRALDNKDFDDDEKDAGELGAGHSVTALFELVPASTARGPIGTLRLRWKDPRGAKSTPIAATMSDEGKSAYEASPDLQFAAAVAELGMLLRDSPHKGTATFADALQLARMSRGVDLDGTREELARLIESASAMRINVAAAVGR